MWFKHQERVIIKIWSKWYKWQCDKILIFPIFMLWTSLLVRVTDGLLLEEYAGLWGKCRATGLI